MDIKHYIARDLDGTLFLHHSIYRPKMDWEGNEWVSDDYEELDPKQFPDLWFLDGPREIKEKDIKKLKLK